MILYYTDLLTLHIAVLKKK